MIKSVFSSYCVPKFRLSLEVRRSITNQINEDFMPKKKKAKTPDAPKKIERKKVSKKKEELQKKEELEKKKIAIDSLMTRNLTFSQYGPPLPLSESKEQTLNMIKGATDDSGGYWLRHINHKSSKAKKQQKEEINNEKVDTGEDSDDGVVFIVDDEVTELNTNKVSCDNSLEYQSKPPLFINPFIRSDINDNSTNKNNDILKIPLSRSVRSQYPSVSKILNVSMSDENRKVLLDWEARMKLELGEQGFEEYKQNTFRRGHAIHSWIENSLLQGSVSHEIDQVIEGDDVTLRHIESVGHVLDKMTDIRALESAVTHPLLQYCGIVDCIGRLNDDICLIDWKTSEKLKPDLKSLYDNPLQLVAYIGAINADPAYKSLESIDKGAVIVIYNSGFSANIHRIPVKKLQNFWSEWLKRLNIFRHKTNFPEVENSGVRF